MLNPGPPRRQLEGVVVWRDGLKVRVEGESTSAVRQVVRQERTPGERWTRAVPRQAYEAARKKEVGPMIGRIRRGRQTARVWMDAGTVERMRRDLEDNILARREKIPFGDG